MATLYEYFNTGDDDYWGNSGNAWNAQTLTPASAHKITSVKLKLYRVGSPGTLTVSIRATDGSGHPTGADLCSGTIDGNGLTTDSGGAWYEITLGAGYDLSASTKYAIVIRAPSGDATNRVRWRCDSSSPAYTGGCREESNDGGATWTTRTASDFMFEDWGTGGGTTLYATATMSGSGDLAAIARATMIAKATTSGTGALAAIGSYLRKASATLSGTGTLAAVGTTVGAAITASATLSGTGALAAAALVTRRAAATMSGTGSLVAAGLVTRRASATMSGEGALAAIARATRKASATMAGSGSLSAAASVTTPGELYASATLSGIGTLTAAAVFYGMTSHLRAAQRNPHRKPYLEARVYDYEQGIKRLTWTRLYDGSETDNHHGIAFDGEGSMHRIRAGSSSRLYYQKVANPSLISDYTQWTQIATDCSGPCAIAAYGAKVYIFYRTITNVLWKYYSHNYGLDWTSAQLTTTADVLSMAACWKVGPDPQSPTPIVVCFAATAIKIYAVSLDTSDQATTAYNYNHGLDTTYGIGATYQDGQFPIVLAGKDTDAGTSIVSYALYATRLSETYNFGALRVLLTADEDVVTAFRYPDCHCPLTPETYETVQLTVVEDYSGITAYTRPLLAHLVKDTDWSSATITEPRFFISISSTYGLRLQSTAGYWWFSTPDGVWRAPRPAADPLDLTPYIQQIHQVIGHQRPGSLVLQLDNSKGYFASPGEGPLASLRFRAEVQLRLGYKTTAGPEALDNLTYWIDSWEYTSEPNRSALTLRCVDLWSLASQWAARYSLRWNYTTFQPCRVWEILYQFLGRLGIRLWNNPDATKSTAMNNYYPKFLSRGGTMGDTQLRRLLSFVTDGLVPTQAICYVKDLLASETSSYEYNNQPGSHPVYAGAYASKLTTTHTQVSGDTEDEPPAHVREAAFDWDLLSLGIDNLRMQYDANLEATDQAAKRADALLRHETLEAMGDQIVVPTNVDQELYDVITVTDRRCGIDQEKYRVLAIQTDYDRHKSLYEQRLTLGAL